MIEFGFDFDPDANGIVDGRDLARSMIQMAYALLVPYVNACPACADALFSAIANGAIEELHRDSDRLQGRVMNVAADPDGSRWTKHIAETGAFTDALMTRDPVHVH